MKIAMKFVPHLSGVLLKLFNEKQEQMLDMNEFSLETETEVTDLFGCLSFILWQMAE